MNLKQEYDHRYYLSGPMSGIEGFNYPRFTQVTDRLRGIGFTVFSPHEIDKPPAHLEGDCLWEWCMQKCMKMMDNCNAILLLEGWSTSRGAKQELDKALAWNWPVFYYLDPPGRPLSMMRRLPEEEAK